MEATINPDIFNDPSNISGLAPVLMENPDGEDLDALEASIMDGDIKKDIDVVARFEKSVKQYGDDFNLFSTTPVERERPVPSTPSAPSMDMSNMFPSDTQPSTPPFGLGAQSNYGSNPNDSPDSESDIELDSDDDDGGGGQNIYENVNTVINDIKTKEGYAPAPQGSTPHYDINRHIREEKRNRQLNEISELRMLLLDEGIPLDTVPEITIHSTDDEIDQVHSILIVKNDRSRYVTLTDEIILSFGKVLEFVFDGKKKYFGHSPNYTGYTDDVLQNRLHRVRYDGSQMISDSMDAWGLGRKTKMALEFIPSLISYDANTKKSKYNEEIDDDLTAEYGT